MWNIARLWVKGSGRLASQAIKTSLTGFSDFTKKAYIFNKIQLFQETMILVFCFELLIGNPPIKKQKVDLLPNVEKSTVSSLFWNMGCLNSSLKKKEEEKHLFIWILESFEISSNSGVLGIAQPRFS